MSSFFKRLLAGPAAAGVLSLGLVGGATAAEKTILDTAKDTTGLGTFVQAVEAAGMTDKLREGSGYTVFAPIDAAFDALPEGKLERLLLPENRDKLVTLLSYHIVPEKLSAKDMGGKTTKPGTLAGETLNINSAGRMTKVDHAAVVTPDIMASNGIVHAIDRVLVPNDDWQNTWGTSWTQG